MSKKKEQNPEKEWYRGNKRRDDILKTIRAAHAQPEVPEDPEPEVPEDPEPEVPEDPEPLTTEDLPSQEVEELPEPTPVSDNEDDLVTIVVDGVEQEVPRSKLLDAGRRTLQKEAAADARLAQAAQILRDAESEKARVAIQTPLYAPSQAEPDKGVMEAARTIIQGIVDGNDDEASEALAKAITGRQSTTPAFDPAELVSRTTQDVRATLAKEEAWNKFNDQYEDIVSDPELFDLADKKTLQVHTEHPEYSFGEVLMEAGKRTRAWVTKLSGGAVTPPGEVSIEKRKATKRASSTRVKGAQLRQPAKPAPKPPTRSDVVANMKRRRGQRY